MRIERADLQGARRVMSSALASAPVKRLPMWQPTPVCRSLSNNPSFYTANKMVITHRPVLQHQLQNTDWIKCYSTFLAKIGQYT